MHLKTKTTHESKAVPGCKFTVRTLNSIQRARRDAAVATQRHEYARLTADLRTALKRHGVEGDEKGEKLANLSAEAVNELNVLDDKARLILDEYLTPNAIRAALVSIEGIDGLTLETLFDEAPDELIEEIAAACNEASGLAAEQQKN